MNNTWTHCPNRKQSLMRSRRCKPESHTSNRFARSSHASIARTKNPPGGCSRNALTPKRSKSVSTGRLIKMSRNATRILSIEDRLDAIENPTKPSRAAIFASDPANNGKAITCRTCRALDRGCSGQDDLDGTCEKWGRLINV